MTAPLNILIIADDLTGAAEIAAVAREFGILARVARPRFAAGSSFNILQEGALAVDTDTRSASPDQAATIFSSLPRIPNTTLVYKKTDSLFRGNPGPEIFALMSLLRKPRALLLPQNPSKRRVIRNGQYFVDEIPLHNTSFSSDPEHPRRSSRVEELLSPAPAIVVDPGHPPAPRGISIGNAETLEQIAGFARDLPENVLPAGGVDFFRALLQLHFASRASLHQRRARSGMLRLIVSGSASEYSRQCVQQWRRNYLPVFTHPADTNTLLSSLHRHKLAILAITDPVDPSRSEALRHTLAVSVRTLLAEPQLARSPVHLFMEGGATAAAIVEALDWHTFDVMGALAPGVVTLKPAAAEHILLTIKPGSYPWPPDFPRRGVYSRAPVI